MATGTIKLKGTFPNADHKLWPGEFVRVVLRLTTQQNAVVVRNAASEDFNQTVEFAKSLLSQSYDGQRVGARLPEEHEGLAAH